MTDTYEQASLPQAATRRSRRISAIWSIPLVAVAVAAWLVWDTLSKEGPTIEVSFAAAEGLEASKSQLKYKDIVFGTVTALRLSPDQSRVIVTIATTAQAKPLLTENAVFWVVKPRLFAGNISGLDTLLSGSYVGLLPSATPGKAQHSFKGQEDPPLLSAHEAGRTFLLKSKRIGSISVGSPIFFRDLAVGEVLGWDIADMARNVTIHAFVRAPYDSYVGNQTRFWNASGISMKLAGNGLDIRMESLRALLLGGIAFSTPPRETHQSVTDENHVFPLFADNEAADAASYTRKISAVSYFPGSVAGISPGSDVTVHGMKIGEVTDVRLTYSATANAIVAPVRYEVQPERIVGIGNRVFETDHQAVDAFLKQGLRANLQTTSLITGEQSVALDFVANATPAEVKQEGTDFLIPATEGGGFANLTSSATDLLNSVRTIPFASIGSSLDGTLVAAQDLVKHLAKGLDPASKRLPEISAQVQKVLGNANALLVSLDAGYGNDTKFNRNLDRLTVQFNDAMRSVRSLADLLQRHPEALIKGRSGGTSE
jgi:paraquat-inducible protein B